MTDTYRTEVSSGYLVAAMREWLADCEWAEQPDNEFIDDLTDAQIVAAVGRHFDGGVPAFLDTMDATVIR